MFVFTLLAAYNILCFILVEQGDAERVAIAFNVMADIILVIAMAALCFAGSQDDQEVMAKVGGILAFVGGKQQDLCTCGKLY